MSARLNQDEWKKGMFRSIHAQMFCLRNGVSDKERKRGDSKEFSTVLCGQALVRESKPNPSHLSGVWPKFTGTPYEPTSHISYRDRKCLRSYHVS